MKLFSTILVDQFKELFNREDMKGLFMQEMMKQFNGGDKQ